MDWVDQSSHLLGRTMGSIPGTSAITSQVGKDHGRQTGNISRHISVRQADREDQTSHLGREGYWQAKREDQPSHCGGEHTWMISRWASGRITVGRLERLVTGKNMYDQPPGPGRSRLGRSAVASQQRS